MQFSMLKDLLDLMNLQYVLETVTDTSMDELMKNEFTGPLGMTKTCFNRGNKYMHDGVAPTEYQTKLKGCAVPNRPQPIWGMVSGICQPPRSIQINISLGRYMTKMVGVLTVYRGMLESFLQLMILLYSVRCISAQLEG